MDMNDNIVVGSESDATEHVYTVPLASGNTVSFAAVQYSEVKEGQLLVILIVLLKMVQVLRFRLYIYSVRRIMDQRFNNRIRYNFIN